MMVRWYQIKHIGDREWTIAEYLRAQKNHAAQMKLGVGFVDSFIVSTMAILDNRELLSNLTIIEYRAQK